MIGTGCSRQNTPFCVALRGCMQHSNYFDSDSDEPSTHPKFESTVFSRLAGSSIEHLPEIILFSIIK
ncbi:hypothetical protein AArcCO_4088 (plasmid) [Halalkaliarchaeum sp. AArc-CO]|nr:hypothetical protein AArcCO_4088 [Halalkaliarchaeum sp. AArc-CO]